MKMAKSYKIVLLILAFIMSTMIALGLMKSPSVYAEDTQPLASTYFNLNSVDNAGFTANGLEITPENGASVSFKNNLIVNKLSMNMKLPKGFKTTISVSLPSFYANGNPNVEKTSFDTTIVNELVLGYNADFTAVGGTLNGKTISDIPVENGYITVNFGVANVPHNDKLYSYLITNNNVVTNLDYDADQMVYYSVKNVDNRAVASEIAIGFTKENGAEIANEIFVLKSVNQMAGDNNYEQSLALVNNALTPATKSRVYLNESFYLKDADGKDEQDNYYENGTYIAKKKAYNETYSISFKVCSVLGDSATLCLVNPENEYDVILESSTTVPDKIRFNQTSDNKSKFGVGKKNTNGDVVIYEEFEVDLVSYDFKDDKAPEYVYDEVAYKSFKNALEKAYTTKNESGATTSVALGTRFYIPSMKDLVFDDFSTYESLEAKVYYRTQSQATTTTGLSFDLSKIGDYIFFVAFSDVADNTMLEKEFMTEKDNEITYGKYGKEKDDNGNVGNFVFKFEIQDNADIIVKAPETQGNGFKGVEYKASSFIVDAAGCRKTYKLSYNSNVNATATDSNWVEIPQASAVEEGYNKGGFGYDEVIKVNYDGELKFVPTRIGAYKIECTATSSVSSRSASNSTIIKVESEAKVVKVPSKWLENNVWSVVFLGVGTLSLIGIIILLCIKPKEKTDKEN